MRIAFDRLLGRSRRAPKWEAAAPPSHRADRFDNLARTLALQQPRRQILRAIGATMAAGLLAELRPSRAQAQLPSCPAPRQVCGFASGPPFDFAFCCPPQAPVCCDPGLTMSSTVGTACCPASHPDCCREQPPDGGGGPTNFGCPAGTPPCGVVGTGTTLRQFCCQNGETCCDPTTHTCCRADQFCCGSACLAAPCDPTLCLTCDGTTSTCVSSCPPGWLCIAGTCTCTPAQACGSACLPAPCDSTRCLTCDPPSGSCVSTCPPGTVCASGTCVCAPTTLMCGGGCCSAGKPCCSGRGCGPVGSTCCGGGACPPGHSVCCEDVACCPDGWSCRRIFGKLYCTII